MSIQSGRYVIVKGDPDNGLRLTLERSDDFFVTLQPRKDVGQTWAVMWHPDGNYMIENSDFDGAQFLFPADMRVAADLVVKAVPFKWRIQQQSRDQNRFHIVVPGGPVDESELAVDQSPVRIFPPKAALLRLDVNNDDQAWFFVKQ